MALQASFTKDGATHAEAYVRVLKVIINRQTSSARAEVGIYADARSAGVGCVACYSYAFNGTSYTNLFSEANLDTAGKNPTKIVYDDIKTYPEWAGASDV